MSGSKGKPAKLPPRPDGWGAMRLTTVGRRTGRSRSVVTGHAAVGAERERLWKRWREIDKDLDSVAARRSTETAVVVLAPQPGM